jgi:hypothetical protein
MLDAAKYLNHRLTSIYREMSISLASHGGEWELKPYLSARMTI